MFYSESWQILSLMSLVVGSSNVCIRHFVIELNDYTETEYVHRTEHKLSGIALT